MILLENVSKSFKGRTVLEAVNMRVDAGELVAYLGPNGAGKTTTIRLIAGQLLPDGGTIKISDFDLRRDSLKAKKMSGLVNQHFSLDAELTVRQNLDLHGRLFGMGRAGRHEAIENALRYVEIWDKADRIIRHLSGGEKRRVMIARALMHNPRVILLDEPSVGLDPAIRRRTWALIRKVKESGVTVLLTTHYIEEAEFLADRVIFINKGRIVKEGRPETLMAEVGQWAVDAADNGELFTSYFHSRDEAMAFIAHRESLTIRRVNLEDAYLKVTGSKIEN